jgi:hypothetical protein
VIFNKFAEPHTVTCDLVSNDSGRVRVRVVSLVVMSSSPNWKKLFAEGIERFRHEDLVGALESFDEV